MTPLFSGFTTPINTSIAISCFTFLVAAADLVAGVGPTDLIAGAGPTSDASAGLHVCF